MNAFDRVAGRPNYTGDCILDATSSRGRSFDVLIFADSRGVLLDRPQASWTVKLFRDLRRQGVSAMLAVRPKDQTGLFTLVNFLERSRLRFKYAVCQAGLIEFTPRTEALLADLIVQKNVLFPDTDLQTRRLDRSLVLKPAGSGGAEAAYETTWALDVDVPAVTDAFVGTLERHFAYTLLLGALELDPRAKIARLRPQSFFDQVCRSNRCLKSLAERSFAVHYVEPIKGWASDSTAFVHDGAHYTPAMHDRMYRAVKSVLLANVPLVS